MSPIRPVSSAVDPKEVFEADRRKKAVQGFEEMFVVQLFKTMRNTVPSGEESRWRKEWQERLDAEFARRIAETGGFGLAPLVKQGLRGDGKGNR